ncbi:MAG: SRPBCC domain-containing protein, partial [Saprospiraceae bacterium]
ECELITNEHSGREIYYRLYPNKMKEVEEWLKPFQQMWENRFNQLDKLLKNKKINSMLNKSLPEFNIDKVSNSVFIRKEFAFPLTLVWESFTNSEILDQWWAPLPWIAKTKNMNFSVGGHWLYAMVSPSLEEHWCIVHYQAIQIHESFMAVDAFCDPNGIINEDLPTSIWEANFTTNNEMTIVTFKISYPNLKQLEAIIEMGFEEGFSKTLIYLDKLLLKLNKN